MKRILTSLILASLLISTLPLNVSADETEDIPTNAAATGVHDSLIAALTQANLVATLQGDGPFTVFAPTDQAFIDAGIDLSTFDTDAENATLVDILTYHVVSGKVMSTDLSDSTAADALNGDKLSFTVSTSEVKVNGAVVTGADVETSNGVIHVIDKVLMPPVDIFVSDGSMTSPFYQFYTDSAGTNAMTEVDITKNYKFQRLNNPSTHPFYISDSGYENNSSAELFIVGDGTSTTGISNDENFTVFFKDGFTVEDTLSYFCTVHSAMVADFTLTAPIVLEDIPTVATRTGIHTSLIAALAQANLVASLQGDGPFTVFAPTDQAFTDAGIDLSTFDTDAENATLVDILTYHVVSSSVLSTALTDGLTATALNGDNLTFTVNDSGVMVNDANVVTADVAASNGVVHVIDKVLMPPAEPVVEPEEPVLAACDAIVRIAPSGLKFSPAEVTISVGQTVCWQWENESMAHNIREVDGDQSTTYAANGVTSGMAMNTVDFRYTFETDSTTFHYACEPHLATGMFGKVLVGDGGVVATPPVTDNSMDSEEESVPGFLVAMTTIALVGAAFVSSRRHE